MDPPMAQMISTIRNGVDTQQLFGTLDTIAEKPELGAFTFRAALPRMSPLVNRLPSIAAAFAPLYRASSPRSAAYIVESA